jgi:ABC-type bacteriocin/lantibiotic exporter with double-glycine peptidase domain
MIFIIMLVAFAFFFYFQKRTSDRNMEKFQRSREKYEQLLERLRKNQAEEETKKEPGNDK